MNMGDVSGIVSSIQGDELQDNYYLGAYKQFHRFTMPWSCFSLDLLNDCSINNEPNTVVFAAGLQSHVESKTTPSSVIVVKATNLYSVANYIENPVIHAKEITTTSNINRVRSCPQDNNLLAILCEDNTLSFHGGTDSWSEFLPSTSSSTLPSGELFRCLLKSSGFGLGFSPHSIGLVLAAGSLGEVNILTPSESTWVCSTVNCHSSSVEDLSFSPMDMNCFALASTDKTVSLWDSRTGNRTHSIYVSDCDVNSVCFATNSPFSLAAGDDEGVLTFWDTRYISEPILKLDWCKSPICSISYGGKYSNELAVSYHGLGVAIVDPSVESVDQNSAIANIKGYDVPAQILFFHEGLSEVQEAKIDTELGAILCCSNEGVDFFSPNYDVDPENDEEGNME